MAKEPLYATQSRLRHSVGVAVRLASNHKLLESGVGIELAREAIVGKEGEQYLGGRTNRASTRNMPSEHLTARVGNGCMQVRAIYRYRAGQGQYLKIAAQRHRYFGACESQLRDAEAPDALEDERRGPLALTRRVLDGSAQIITGRKAQRKGLHAR